MPKIQDKIRQQLIWSLKFFVMLLGFGVLGWSLQSTREELNLWTQQWNESPDRLFFAVLLVSILSSLNWFGEVKKWQKLVGHISFSEALKQSLIGHSLSLFTPNKWGEYGGKCLFFAKEQSSKIIALTGLGHLCQMMITLLFGSFGLLMIHKQFEIFDVFQLKWSWVLLVTLILIGIAMCFKLVRVKLSLIWLHFKSIKTEKIKTALLWSGFRYVVFAHQFLLLLWCFGADVGYLKGVTLIAVVYLLTSVIPIFAIADAVVKGSIAVVLMSFFGLPIPAVLLTVFLMWIGNVILPAFGGYIWLWSWQPKYLKTKT